MNRMAVLRSVIVLLSLSAVRGMAQTAASPAPAAAQPAPTSETAAPLPVVTLDESVAAARVTSPNLKLATIALNTAQAALAQTRAQNGVTLGETGTYFHQGSLTGGTSTVTTASSTAAAAASGSGINGENIQGGLSLAGPATSVGLTAQHSIGEGALTDQVSSLSVSASQTVFDGYPGGRSTGAVQQAEAAYRIAQVSYDAAMKSALYQVKQAYYTLLGDQDTVV